MPTDPTIIMALVAAVEKDPENTALRMHLAELLLEAKRAGEALEQYTAVLSKQPDHLDALSKAARAAQETGDAARSESYRRLYEALSGHRAQNMVENAFGPTSPAPPASTTQGASPLPLDDANLAPLPLSDDGFEGAWEAERPEITLADVAGMEEVKRRLNLAFLAPMRNPDMMKMYGKSLRGGLLLYGPPGCGKTFIARATAGELGARFISVGLSDVLDMFLGQSERNLHNIFQAARRLKPCVVFLDEIDALGRKRTLRRDSVGRDIVNQLLTEMDSVEGNNEGVFVLAATNHPWDVDTALRRPGRLDRTLLVLPPDQTAREAILRYYLRDRPVVAVDLPRLAAHLDGYSGADVAHLCDSAAELALEDSLARGIARPIDGNDFQRALREVKPSVLPWFDTARNYAMFSNEGGVYDDLVQYLRAHNLL